MSTLTLMEAAKHHSDEVEASIARIIVESTPFLDKVPFKTIRGAAYRYNREASLGGIAYRGVNGYYTPDTGVINPAVETLAIAGGEVVIDRFDLETQSNLIDLKAEKYMMKARAMGFFFSEQFIEGDTTVNPAGIDGIRRRCTGNQLIDAGSGGATLTLAMVDQLIDSIVGGPDALIMNKTLRRKITSLARAQTGVVNVVETMDSMNRQVTKYANVPIWVVERDDDASTFLDFDEDDGASHLDTSSIYAVKFGMNYIHGISTRGVPRVDTITDNMETRPALLGRLEWYFGLVVKHPRCIARLYHINNA